MNKVDLGKLHAALSGDELVSEAKFANTLKSLLPPADQPDAEVIKALFKAFDTDGSGGGRPKGADCGLPGALQRRREYQTAPRIQLL